MNIQVVKRRCDNDLVTSIVRHKLSNLAPLGSNELELIGSCALRPREYPSGVRLPAFRRPLGSVVVSGWVGRLQLFADGRRQIVSTMVPGELAGPHINSLISNTTVALTDAWVADLSPMFDAMDRQPDGCPRLRRALALAAQLEELQMAEQIVRLGRRTAFERFANWLLDLQQRLELAGLCNGDSFQMPLTQELLSDILGMSIVHVNRIVKQLRSEQLIELKNNLITILEPERLAMIAEFTPLMNQGLADTAADAGPRKAMPSLR